MTGLTERRRPSVTRLIFLWGGPVFIVVGLIAAFLQKSQGDRDRVADRISDNIAKSAGTPDWQHFADSAGGDYSAAWVWLFIAALGLGLLIAGIALGPRRGV